MVVGLQVGGVKQDAREVDACVRGHLLDSVYVGEVGLDAHGREDK